MTNISNDSNIAKSNFFEIDRDIPDRRFYGGKDFPSVEDAKRWVEALLESEYSGPETKRMIMHELHGLRSEPQESLDIDQSVKVSDITLLLLGALRSQQLKSKPCLCSYCGQEFRFGDAREHIETSTSSTSKTVSTGLTGGSVVRKSTITTTKRVLYACPSCHDKIEAKKTSRKRTVAIITAAAVLAAGLTALIIAL